MTYYYDIIILKTVFASILFFFYSLFDETKESDCLLICFVLLFLLSLFFLCFCCVFFRVHSIMGKTFLKTGKVVVLLNGRYAGKKAVIVKSFDGTKTRHYGHCLVAGVRRCPRRITKSMTKKEILRRTSMRPFVKVINWNHMMPTRFVSSCFLEEEKEKGSAIVVEPR